METNNISKMKTIKASKFYFDGETEVFEGYTDGQNWNGFAVPLFDRHTAFKVLKQLYGVQRVGFVYDGDYFVVKYNDGEVDFIDGVDILIDGVEKTLYDCGLGLCWLSDDMNF